MSEKYACQESNATMILDWMRNRGGILIWNSVNLSNPGASWTTPALSADGSPTIKPSWQAANEPSRKITDIADVEVVKAVEIKRFHVAVRRGSQGFALKVTPGGSNRIQKEVSKAANGKWNKPTPPREAWYEFNYGAYDNVIIYAEGERRPLAECAT